MSSNQSSWLELDKGEKILFNCYTYASLEHRILCLALIEVYKSLDTLKSNKCESLK